MHQLGIEPRITPWKGAVITISLLVLLSSRGGVFHTGIEPVSPTHKDGILPLEEWNFL